jgi:hypothetical protein
VAVGVAVADGGTSVGVIDGVGVGVGGDTFGVTDSPAVGDVPGVRAASMKAVGPGVEPGSGVEADTPTGGVCAEFGAEPSVTAGALAATEATRASLAAGVTRSSTCSDEGAAMVYQTARPTMSDNTHTSVVATRIAADQPIHSREDGRRLVGLVGDTPFAFRFNGEPGFARLSRNNTDSVLKRNAHSLRHTHPAYSIRTSRARTVLTARMRLGPEGRNLVFANNCRYRVDVSTPAYV